MTSPKKIRKYLIHLDLLRALVQTGNVIHESVVVEGLPEDAEIILGSMHEKQFAFVVRSESFRELQDKEEIPFGVITIRRVEQ